MNEQARRSSPPNRVRSPTDRQFASGCSPPCLGANAVTFGYGVVAYSGTDFHRANVAPLQAHSFPRKREGGFTFEVQQITGEDLRRSFVVKTLSRSVIIGSNQRDQALFGKCG